MSSQGLRNHYPALDGIRGLAILLVVFFHNFGFLQYFGFGWLGVDLFFVLSGYLITDILIRSIGNKHYLRNFYLKRILRIFPLYYLVVSVTVFILPSISRLWDNLQFYVNNQWWLWLYLQNWLYVIKEPEQTNFLLHFWSLAVEEQFYLFWPWVILLFRKPGRLITVTIFILIGVIITRIILWVNQVEGLEYFGLYTFTRIDGLCIGSLLALIMFINRDWLSKYTGFIVLIIAGLNFLFYFLNRASNFSFPFFPFIGYTTFAIVFAVLVYEAVQGKTKIINLIFTNPILRFFGTISYGFYVFHWPVYVGLNSWFRNLLNSTLEFQPIILELLVSILATALAFVISIFSYYFFESRFLKLKSYFNTV